MVYDETSTCIGDNEFQSGDSCRTVPVRYLVKANRLAYETSPYVVTWTQQLAQCAPLYIAPAGFLQQRILKEEHVCCD